MVYKIRRFGFGLCAVVVGMRLLLLTPAGAQPPTTDSAPAAPVVLGPVHDVVTITRFGTEPAGAWTPNCGQNVQYHVTPAAHAPGVPDPVLEAQVQRKDPQDREGSHTWFSLTRKDLPPPALPADTDGLRIVLGSVTEAQWWISPTLTTDKGETFSIVLDASVFPAGRLVQWVLPFDRFRSPKNEPLTLDKARTIRSIAFATSSPGTALLFDRITAYRRDRLHGWLDFRTNHPTNNLFQRTDPVGFTFSVGGKLPDGAAGFRYEVRDYEGKVAVQGSESLTGAPSYAVPAAPYAPGYYEVTAYWTDANGKDLVSFSCIRGEGTVPDGLGTFSVLPHTIAENAARSRKFGENAFFGLHGDFLGLADYLGMTWCFPYTGWIYEEPTRPDRSSGVAPWAKAALDLPAKPSYRFHIQPFNINLNGSVPTWARTNTGKAPGFVWEDALAMVRDTVAVNRHDYPQMAHRLYGGLWEVDLNGAPYGTQQPPYSPTDIADAYRRIHDVVKSADPSGMVIGPCSSVIRPDWFEAVFKAGVLDWVDGIETHAYCDGTLTPEADDLPGRIHKLKALIRQYHHGKDLPIYVTEAGQPGIIGADVVYRSQAERMVRAGVILKGEGVQVFLPFYGIDYERSGYWGFLYNLDVDSRSGPWSTKRTSPKPMVNAMATCVDMLEGAKPEGALPTLGTGVWAYAFRRDSETITAVWAPTGKRDVDLPVSARRVEVVDMMGHARHEAVTAKTVRLSIGEAPVYVISSAQ